MTLIVPFVLSYFTRIAPGTFAGVVANDLGIGATSLGLATGMYFYVYTAMQVPSGLIIDRYGVRRSVAAGTVVAAGGLALYASAQSLLAAAAGSALIGLGTSTSFVGILRANTSWYSGSLFGLMSGLTLMLGNLGAVAAGEPLAALLGLFTWRQILVATAALCAVSALAVVIFVRLPHQESTTDTGNRGRRRILTVVLNCARDRVVVLLIVAAIGTNSTFYAFSGLWGTPFLTRGVGMSVAGATSVISAAVLVYGAVSLGIGRVADRSSNKARLVVLAGALSAVAWIGVLVSVGGPVWLATCAVLAAGAAAGGVVVGFSLVSERFAGPDAATALALINGAMFLGAAVLQPVFGWLFDLVRLPPPSADPLQASTSDFVPGIVSLLLVSVAGLVGGALRVTSALTSGRRELPVATRM